MRSDDRRRNMARKTHVESLEDRVVMAADPLGGLLGGSISHHAWLEDPAESPHEATVDLHSEVDPLLQVEAPPLSHHLQRDADFWIDSWQDYDVEHHLGQIEQTLANAHNQTGMTQVRADYGFRGGGQTVAVIDSGIAYDHLALGGGFGANYRVVGGFDFTESDGDPFDDGPEGSHGTHVAGIVGSDSSTHTGVAPDVDLVGLRVFDDDGNGFFSWVEQALNWVHNNRNSFENPITAVNLSLGTDWNSDSIPSWAMLENEFAQLKADGIFISVSAGNSFTSYNTPGLSYPAASSHVVPVMSTDDSGMLSYFSQRHTRAIAAPGRTIVSTVPDYIGNNNGVTDDFASFSGTSMAAPYVAGASVIIREAMEFVGTTNITQDTIFNHMVSTADQVFDSNTGLSYDRLNLEAAIDALMPTDDYGSSVSTAFALGTILGDSSIDGTVGKLDDADYFTFTAGVTGTIAFTATTTHDLAASWDGPGVVSGANGETCTIDVVAGQTYTVGLSTNDGLGHYELAIDAESTFTYTDWGTVTFNQVNDVIGTGDTWYGIVASQAGYVTTEAMFANVAGNVDLALYDANLQQVGSSNGVGDSERIDYLANQGEQLFLRVSGTNADIDFRLTNLVSVNGTVVDVGGTSGDDTFTFTAGSTHGVSVNGVAYAFGAGAVSTVNFNGGAGADSITVTGAAGAETAVLRLGWTQVTGQGYGVVATNMENVTVSGDSADIAYVYDTAGDDQLVANATSATLSGTNFSHSVTNFGRTFTFATAGGDDVATFYDGATNDQFVGTSQYAIIRSFTGEFDHYASGFKQVTAHATAGGADVAQFYDGTGNDELIARPDTSYLRSLDGAFWNQANNFEQVLAFAGSGGTDTASFYDSAGGDLFVGTASYALMQANDLSFYNYASGFSRNNAFSEAGGTDIAQLYDGTSNDLFVGASDYSELRNLAGQFWNYVNGFGRVNAFATAGGQDEAYLYDGEGDDQFVGAPQYSLLRSVANEFYNFTFGFDTVRAYANGGGDNDAFFYDSVGDDVFVSTSDYSQMLTGNGHLNYASGFDLTFGFATAGGNDAAHLHDTDGDDVLYGRSDYAYLFLTGGYHFARGFETISAYSNVGNDAVDVDAVDYVFDEVGNWA